MVTMLRWSDHIKEHLRDKDNAKYFIKGAFENYKEHQNSAFFLSSLRTLIHARGKFSDVAKKAGISRQHLYRMLSDKGDPKMSSVVKLLSALDLTIAVEKLHHSR